MIAWKYASGQKFRVYLFWVTSHIENHGPYYIVCTVLDVPKVHIGGLMWHGRRPLGLIPIRSLSMLLPFCAEKSPAKQTHCSVSNLLNLDVSSRVFPMKYRYHIATKFCTCHDSTAVVPCAKFHSDHFMTSWMRAVWNFHRIWITMEKSFVKWAPDSLHSNDKLGCSLDTDGLVQERRNSSALAMELRLLCTDPSIHAFHPCHDEFIWGNMKVCFHFLSFFQKWDCAGIFIFFLMEDYYAKLSRVMQAPWMDRFGNTEIYCYLLSKMQCGPCSDPLRSPSERGSSPQAGSNIMQGPLYPA